MVPVGSEVNYEHEGSLVKAKIVGHEGDTYILEVPGVAGFVRAEPKREPDVFRFIISCVTVSGGRVETVHESAIIEAHSFEEAAEVADATYPKSQISITRIGKCVNVRAQDFLPMVSGATA